MNHERQPHNVIAADAKRRISILGYAGVAGVVALLAVVPQPWAVWSMLAWDALVLAAMAGVGWQAVRSMDELP